MVCFAKKKKVSMIQGRMVNDLHGDFFGFLPGRTDPKNSFSVEVMDTIGWGPPVLLELAGKEKLVEGRLKGSGYTWRDLEYW